MKQAIYALMALFLIGAVSAGTISDDCTRTDTRCAQTDRICTNWNWGHCQHWSTICVQYEEYCTDSITTETDIDADTVQGVDVLQVIADNDAKWSQDNVGGGGTSLDRVQKWAFGDFLDYLKGIFTPKEDYAALEDKTYLLEAKLYCMENDMACTADDLFFKAVTLEMEEKNTTSVEHGRYSCSVSFDQLICVG